MTMKTERMLLTSLVTVLILACLVFTYACSDGIYYGYSEGERSGKVIKLSYKGLIWKSYEATVLMEGMQSRAGKGGTTFAPNLFECTTLDEAIAKDLESARKSGEPVTVAYKQFLIGPWWYDTVYDVLEVKP